MDDYSWNPLEFKDSPYQPQEGQAVVVRLKAGRGELAAIFKDGSFFEVAQQGTPENRDRDGEPTSVVPWDSIADWAPRKVKPL